MKNFVLFMLIILLDGRVFSQMAVYDVLVHQSIVQLSTTEAQELTSLNNILQDTKTNTKNTYKVYEEVKRSSNFLDKLYQVTEETQNILEGKTKLADTIRSNESQFLKTISQLVNEASKIAQKMSGPTLTYQEYLNQNIKSTNYESKLSEVELFLSDIAYMLNKAIECRKLASIHDKDVPLSPKERFDLKSQADDLVHNADMKIKEFRGKIIDLEHYQKQFIQNNPNQKKEIQKNSNYHKTGEEKQPVIGKGLKN